MNRGHQPPRDDCRVELQDGKAVILYDRMGRLAHSRSGRALRARIEDAGHRGQWPSMQQGYSVQGLKRAARCSTRVLLPAAWMANRSAGMHRTGLPLSTWIDNVRQAHEADNLAFGTVESWIAYVSLKLFFTPLSQLTV